MFLFIAGWITGFVSAFILSAGVAFGAVKWMRDVDRKPGR